MMVVMCMVVMTMSIMMVLVIMMMMIVVVVINGGENMVMISTTSVFIPRIYPKQVTNSPCQLEITIMTCQPAHFISAQVSKLSETLDLNCLKVKLLTHLVCYS